MTERDNIAILFPGQGVVRGGGWLRFRRCYPAAAGAFGEIDNVSLRCTGELASDMLRSHNPRPRPNAALSLAVYGAAIAVYRAMDPPPAVLVGHGFGEIAASVCAGLLSVTQGAEVVCARYAALREAGAACGAMISLECDEKVAGYIVRLAGEAELAVAAINSDRDTVLSGSLAAVRTAERIADGSGIQSRRLHAPYPLHSALLATARESMRLRLGSLTASDSADRFFSTTLGRYVGPADDITDVMASVFTRTVRLSNAVQHLHSAGANVFIECGAMQGLSRYIRATLGDSAYSILHACLDSNRAELFFARGLRLASRSTQARGHRDGRESMRDYREVCPAYVPRYAS